MKGRAVMTGFLVKEKELKQLNIDTAEWESWPKCGKQWDFKHKCKGVRRIDCERCNTWYLCRVYLACVGVGLLVDNYVNWLNSPRTHKKRQNNAI